MTIITQVTQAIKETENTVSLNSEQINKGMEFTKKMEHMGIIHLNQHFREPIREGGLDQLKLYVISHIN